jgi:hypothetical protein
MRRVRLHLASRYLLIKSRPAAVLALAMAGALAATGVALAAGTSTSTFTFSPRVVTKIAYKPGKIAFHTHTNYTNPGNSNPGGAAKRVQLNFDNDFKLDHAAARTCTASLAGKDMAQAIATGVCASAMIGSGSASAIDNAFVSSPTIHGCVLVFNRPANHVLLFLRMKDTNPSSITCANPSSNHQGNTTVLLPGVLVPSPLGGDYDTQLDVNNIVKDPSHPNASPFPLTDLNVSIQSGSYASARCFDADRTWNLQTKFTYNDNTTQTLNSTSACLVA